MKIDITLQQVSKKSKIRDKIIRKTRLALGRFATAIQKIKISITDVNGPKGGIDTKCVVNIKLVNAGEIITQGQGENISSALNTCLPRAGRTIARNLERRRETGLRMIRRKKPDFDKEELSNTI